MCAVFFCIAKNQEKQEKLRKTILEILPNESDCLNEENMKNLPYLRACIKEALRLYPVISGMSRQAGSDMILSGYQIPKGTNVICWPQLFYRDEKYFQNPNDFIPERWIRNDTWNKQFQSYFMPFGFGLRACIGKRIANMEMECLLTNLIRNYKIECEMENYNFKSTFINVPIGEMKFKITKI